ncbi:TetR/AcrR family transcriptional regulator [Rhizobium bangladeshense]|uniref:TetR/AcrR family transcriptional regulator n=1 Tax=Rhizobium bangladeshense TaxID=1138189 RepID=A0ABS7LN86_9HYPH|nr:TetR/AcrR family transcriptional regulator [Rhizobium bangladeshense]MBX4867566.1 TetR/AcrR family transcriptional regulator [Rhizobium bangladeshense]MBX4871858.1 TetR/AcrR family transcriptional regulator [Rhizobium bangladeshense]MBX4883172.1 TetR/AcrR family transcriptional regulator [Rhizobium bangladeshense]MBX4897911.1 TetR/AcrR family transcriptional regulator [Rhizobium bangladeshense]MBX4901395.1 TetR/AcrR family transcriptional regulator [Rhizobium bangladeshense]
MAAEKKITRAEQKALRPIQILDAAFEEFVRCGFAGTRVEDIAERVGVTKGTVYVYFETKETLFEAMINHFSVPFQELLAITDELSGSATERLKSILSLLYEQIAEDRTTRELVRLVIAEGQRFPDLIDRHHDEFIAPIIAKIDSLIVEGMASGEFRQIPVEFSDMVVAPILTRTVLRLIFDDRRDPIPNKEAFLRTYFDLLFNGLLAKPG